MVWEISAAALFEMPSRRFFLFDLIVATVWATTGKGIVYFSGTFFGDDH